MANRLKMAQQKAIEALHEQGWSQRRIARELGVHRETVGRYVRRAEQESRQGEPGPEESSKPAISITGSAGSKPVVLRSDPEETSKPAISITGSVLPISGLDPPKPALSIPGSTGRQSLCEPFREVIIGKLDQGLSAQRIWQDLKIEQGFEGRLSIGPTFCPETESDHAAGLSPPGMRTGAGSADRLRHRRSRHRPRRQETPYPRFPNRPEPLPQRLQRSRLPTNHRGVHSMHRERLLSLWRSPRYAYH